MTDLPASQLVGVAYVAKRTGLGRRTIERAAKAGRLPGFFLCDRWKFDPAAIEAWVQARSNEGTTESARVSAEPSRAAPAAQDHQRGRATIPAPESTPPLVVIYETAPWRGIHDRPSEQTAKRPARRRRAGATKTAASAN